MFGRSWVWFPSGTQIYFFVLRSCHLDQFTFHKMFPMFHLLQSDGFLELQITFRLQWQSCRTEMPFLQFIRLICDKEKKLVCYRKNKAYLHPASNHYTLTSLWIKSPKMLDKIYQRAGDQCQRSDFHWSRNVVVFSGRTSYRALSLLDWPQGRMVRYTLV